MRILFDCRYTRIGRHDGISRFTAGLVTALAERHAVTMLISDHRQLELLPDLPWELIASPTAVGEPWIARQVNKLKPDIVFTPMQTMGGFGRRYRLVLTVHDLIYYRHPTPPRDLPGFVRVLWRLYHLAWWPQRLLLNRSDAVVTVSETTKALIAEHRLTRRPVSVVPNAADIPPWEALTGWFGRFIDYVATKRALVEEMLATMTKDAPVFRTCHDAIFGAGEPLLERAKQAGVVRPDVEFAEAIALVSGVTMVRNATPEQMKRVLTVALDGLRYGAPGSELIDAGTGMPGRRSGAGRGRP